MAVGATTICWCFGEQVREYRDAAQRIRDQGKRTFAPERLDGLIRAVVGQTDVDHKTLDLRYQLFSAVAGTVAAAVDHEALQAVFVVHEFATSKTTEEKRSRNAADLAAFIDVVFPDAGARMRRDLPTCREHGMGVLTWSPLAGGWLSGAWRKDQPAPASTRAERLPQRNDLSMPENQAKV